MSEIPRSEEPKAPKITVNLDPVAQFEEAEAAMARNAIALEKQRAENERALRSRQQSEDEVDSLLTHLDPKGEEVVEMDEDSKPIPRAELGRYQIDQYNKMWLERSELNAIVKAMGIDINSKPFGPKFADKVAAFQSEKLGFTWDDPEAVKAGRVPNGIIDVNTLVEMANRGYTDLNIGEVVAKHSEKMHGADRTQERYFIKMGFNADQVKALFDLVGAHHASTTDRATTREGLKLFIQEFQMLTLGFMSEERYYALPKSQRAGKNVADGYFGPKTLAVLRAINPKKFFEKDERKQELLAILLGKKVEKAA